MEVEGLELQSNHCPRNTTRLFTSVLQLQDPEQRGSRGLPAPGSFTCYLLGSPRPFPPLYRPVPPTFPSMCSSEKWEDSTRHPLPPPTPSTPPTPTPRSPGWAGRVRGDNPKMFPNSASPSLGALLASHHLVILSLISPHPHPAPAPQIPVSASPTKSGWHRPSLTATGPLPKLTLHLKKQTPGRGDPGAQGPRCVRM